MKNTKLLTVIIFSLLVSCAYAGGAGSAAGGFLKLGVGAKAAALGDAMTAAASGVEAVYWNPAGVAGIKEGEAAFSHTLWAVETAHTSAGFAMPLGEKSALGVLVNYFSAGTMEKIDNTGLAVGTFTASDLSAAVCYSTKFGENLPVGISLKYISGTIDNSTGSAFAADLGLKYEFSHDFSLAAAVLNLGTKLKYSLLEESLPMNIKAGILFRVAGVALSADISSPSDAAFGWSAGGEYLLNLGGASVALRGGYNTNTTAGGLCAGAGVSLGGFCLDYAMIMFGDLGNNQRFSVKFKL
ncbi:MAG: PorV/PorQ family protein [Candidatus Firestonebacteria bacterium]